MTNNGGAVLTTGDGAVLTIGDGAVLTWGRFDRTPLAKRTMTLCHVRLCFDKKKALNCRMSSLYQYMYKYCSFSEMT